jgi:hypothetical protein
MSVKGQEVQTGGTERSPEVGLLGATAFAANTKMSLEGNPLGGAKTAGDLPRDPAMLPRGSDLTASADMIKFNPAAAVAENTAKLPKAAMDPTGFAFAATTSETARTRAADQNVTDRMAAGATVQLTHNPVREELKTKRPA